MTRQERIQELKNQIDAKRHEIIELQEQLDSEMVSDFHETNNLREGQHFIYDNKECVGVKCEDGVLKTFRRQKRRNRFQDADYNLE